MKKSVLPTGHQAFLAWAANLSQTLEHSTRGHCRVGKNKLAACMAASLPDAPAGFNLNSLKAHWEAPADTVDHKRDAADYLMAAMLEPLRDALTHFGSEIITFLRHGVAAALYDYLDQDDAIDELYAGYHLREDSVQMHTVLSLLEPDRLEEAYRNTVQVDPNYLGEPFHYVVSHVCGYAFVAVLKDTLYCLLSDIQQAYAQAGDPTRLDDAALLTWFQDCLAHWTGENLIGDEDTAVRCEALLQPYLHTRLYGTTLRARLSGPVSVIRDILTPVDWESSDLTTQGNRATLNLTRFVQLQASTPEQATAEAIHNAQLELTALMAQGCDQVNVWTDSPALPERRVKLHDIEYDLDENHDGSDVPSLLFYTLPAGVELADAEDEMSDFISNQTGYCHHGFKATLV